MFRRWISWTKLLWVFLVVGLWVSCSYIFAANDITLINNLKDTIKDTPDRLKIVIESYCDTVLSDPGFTNTTFTYNAKYSAFVYLLCTNMDIRKGKMSKLSSDYFTLRTFADLWFTDFGETTWWFDLCNPAYFDNHCNLSSNIPMLFNSIIEDYINMKQSFLYGTIFPYNWDSELSKMINTNFSQPYFHVDICDNTLHPYEKTCRMIKSSISHIKNIMTEVHIFDTSDTGAILSMKAASTNSSCANDNKDVFYCWLKDHGFAMTHFVNLIYNELYYYRLFVGYYMIVLQQNPQINTDYATILQNFSSEYVWSKNAISLSLRMMRDMYIAFPFHIWLSMYQEDIDVFSKSFVHILPPIYTLYDKLRNVQSPE